MSELSTGWVYQPGDFNVGLPANQTPSGLDPDPQFTTASSNNSGGGGIWDLLPLLFGGALAYGAGSGNSFFEPSTIGGGFGYQGDVPEYNMVRAPLHYEDENRRPGSYGRAYFTDAQFVPDDDFETATGLALNQAEDMYALDNTRQGTSTNYEDAINDIVFRPRDNFGTSYYTEEPTSPGAPGVPPGSSTLVGAGGGGGNTTPPPVTDPVQGAGGGGGGGQTPYTAPPSNVSGGGNNATTQQWDAASLDAVQDLHRSLTGQSISWSAARNYLNQYGNIGGVEAAIRASLGPQGPVWDNNRVGDVQALFRSIAGWDLSDFGARGYISDYNNMDEVEAAIIANLAAQGLGPGANTETDPAPTPDPEPAGYNAADDVYSYFNWIMGRNPNDAELAAWTGRSYSDGADFWDQLYNAALSSNPAVVNREMGDKIRGNFFHQFGGARPDDDMVQFILDQGIVPYGNSEIRNYLTQWFDPSGQWLPDYAPEEEPVMGDPDPAELTPEAQAIYDIYNRLFERDPQQQGLDYWLGTGLSGNELERRIRYGATGDDVATVRENDIYDYYNQYFGRDPGSAGLNYWLNENPTAIWELGNAIYGGARGDDLEYLTNNGIGALQFAGGGQVPQPMQMGTPSPQMQGNYLGGPQDGLADQIPAIIDGAEPAALSGGEYVIPADAVSGLGNGNSEAGAAKLDEIVGAVRTERTGSSQQPKPLNVNKLMGIITRGKS